LVVFFLLPWLDRSSVASMRYKGWMSKLALGIFAVSFLALGYLGTRPPTPQLTLLAQVFTLLYFAYFFLMPFYSRLEKTKPVPERLTK